MHIFVCVSHHANHNASVWKSMTYFCWYSLLPFQSMCNERPPVAKPGHEGSTTSIDSTWWPSSRHSIQGTPRDINWQEIYCDTVWREEAKVTKKPPAWQSLIEFGDIWRLLEHKRFSQSWHVSTCVHIPLSLQAWQHPQRSHHQLLLMRMGWNQKQLWALAFVLVMFAFASLLTLWLCIEMASEQVFAGPSSNGYSFPV